METNTLDLSDDFQRLTHFDNLGPHHPQNLTLSNQYGSLTSQYDTIPASVAALLEQANLYCRVRAFAQCHSTLRLIDPDFTCHPVVAYEKFLAYWAQWSLADSATVLEDALLFAQKSDAKTETYGIYTLLRIALGRAEVFTKGDFTKARDGMKEVRRWLREVPLDMYTDVQVACLGHYYILIMAANLVTDNFDHQSFEKIPKAPEDEGAQKLSRLRQVMQSQGRLRDARLVLSFELGFLPNENAKQEACKSLIAACADAGDKEPAWALEGTARSTLAQSLRRSGDAATATKEIELALDLLDKGPVRREQNKAHLMVTLDQMKATTYTDCRESYKAWNDLYDQDSVKVDSSVLSTVLEKITEAALEVLQGKPSAENKAIFWNWQRRYESLLQHLGDVNSLYMSRLYTVEVALKLFDEFGAIVRWHEEFEAQHPDFGLWTMKIAGKQSLAFLYVKFEQQDEVLKIFSEISAIMRQRDAFWIEASDDKEQYTPQNIGNLDPPVKTADANIERPAFVAENAREEWFSEWVGVGYIGLGREFKDYTVALGPQLPKGTDKYMSTLLRWLRNAIAEDEITNNDLEFILGIPAPGASAELIEIETKAERLTPEILYATLYGPDHDPTSSERWDSVFDVFQRWLIHHTKYNETKRHVLLGSLQAERLDQLVSTFRLTDIVRVAEKTLNLLPIFCEEAQQHFKGRTVNWRNVLCHAKRGILSEESPENSWNEQSAGFREILDMYNVSLQESRERGHLLNEAATLLFIAQHYHHGALLLRPAAVGAFFQNIDESNTVFNKSRESWKVLKGFAKVEKLLSAVQEQLRLTIAPLAASVIYNFPNEKERAGGLWNIVQVAKSNGLAWLMQTNGLEGSKRAEDPGRLDVDFEELPSLTPEDLNPISQDAGDSLCYVDWYNGSFAGYKMPNPIVVTRTSSGSIKAVAAPMTWQEIDAVIDRFMSFEESELRTDNALRCLQKLNPLVAPLATTTEPGQTIVFCPIGNLHRLPLHALEINGEFLIERNPIVYCSSLTVLSVVFKGRKAAEQQRATSNDAINNKNNIHASLFGDPPSQPGKKALASLARKLHTAAQTGDAFTSANLSTALTDPALTLLHYHGHVTFQEGDPKDHGLELDDRRFTLRDVFDLPHRPLHTTGYHATLLGCSSGMSKTTVSNDVLGLVSAFLYAGASSTVSALWPFDDKDAAMYTRVFYEGFGDGGEAAVVVDLAKANQKAVLRIREKRPALYHWGVFVVNGWWMMRG